MLITRRTNGDRAIRAKLKNIVTGEIIEVRSTTDSIDSSDGLEYWVDLKGNNFGQCQFGSPVGFEIFEITGDDTISSETHTKTRILNDGDVSVYEVSPDKGPVSDKRFYVVREYAGKVFSILSNDMSRDGGSWVSSSTPGGIAHVASPKTRKTAMTLFRRLIKMMHE